MPVIAPDFATLRQMLFQKRVTNIFFTHLLLLTPQWDPLGQTSRILELMYSKAQSINVQNFGLF